MVVGTGGGITVVGTGGGIMVVGIIVVDGHVVTVV